MSEPLSARAQSLLSAARAVEPALDDATRARMREAVLQAAAGSMAAGAGAGVLETTTALSAKTAASVALASVAGAALVIAGAVAWRSRGAPDLPRAHTHATASSSAPVLVASAAPSSASVTAPEIPVVSIESIPNVASSGRAARATPPLPAASRGDDRFGAELGALERARAAIAAGDPRRALRELDELALVSAPSEGVFVEERSALRIVALCGTGRREEGRAELGRFREAFPRSLQTDRAAHACAE